MTTLGLCPDNEKKKKKWKREEKKGKKGSSELGLPFVYPGSSITLTRPSPPYPSPTSIFALIPSTVQSVSGFPASPPVRTCQWMMLNWSRQRRVGEGKWWGEAPMPLPMTSLLRNARGGDHIFKIWTATDFAQIPCRRGTSHPACDGGEQQSRPGWQKAGRISARHRFQCCSRSISVSRFRGFLFRFLFLVRSGSYPS